MYCIWIVSPPGYIYSHSFDEVAIGLQSGLRELGHEAEIVTEYPLDGKIIVLGAHLAGKVPDGSIIFNLEQIDSDSVFVNDRYINMLRGAEVWDYSHQNIAELKRLGIEAKYCGIGYARELTRIPDAEKKIDVLFVGSINQRRMEICNKLAKQCNVHVAYDCYGEERDKLIARAKIVLNVHFYDSKIFELARCSYLMANKVCIVSEYGQDEKLEAPFQEGICFSHYDCITNDCLHILKTEEWKTIGENGFEIFSQMKQADYLREAL